MATTVALSSASPSAPIMGYSGPTVLATWTALANAITGDSLQTGNFIASSAQVSGTFGVAGSIQLEGSNDGVNWLILPDADLILAIWTQAYIKFFRDSPMWLRPRVTNGDGTTALSIKLVLRRWGNNGGF